MKVSLPKKRLDELFNQSDYADWTVSFQETGSQDTVGPFHVHSPIIGTQSEFFAAAMRHPMKESQTKHISITVPLGCAHLGEQVLRSFYQGEVDIPPDDYVKFAMVLNQLQADALLTTLLNHWQSITADVAPKLLVDVLSPQLAVTEAIRKAVVDATRRHVSRNALSKDFLITFSRSDVDPEIVVDLALDVFEGAKVNLTDWISTWLAAKTELVLAAPVEKRSVLVSKVDLTLGSVLPMLSFGVEGEDTALQDRAVAFAIKEFCNGVDVWKEFHRIPSAVMTRVTSSRDLLVGHPDDLCRFFFLGEKGKGFFCH